MTDIQKLLGTNIKAARKQLGLTQNDLSEKASISQEHLTQVERGVRYPSAKILQQIANALNTKVYKLFYDESEAKTNPEIKLHKKVMELKKVLKQNFNENVDELFQKFLE